MVKVLNGAMGVICLLSAINHTDHRYMVILLFLGLLNFYAMVKKNED